MSTSTVVVSDLSGEKYLIRTWQLQGYLCERMARGGTREINTGLDIGEMTTRTSGNISWSLFYSWLSRSTRRESPRVPPSCECGVWSVWRTRCGPCIVNTPSEGGRSACYRYPPPHHTSATSEQNQVNISNRFFYVEDRNTWGWPPPWRPSPEAVSAVGGFTIWTDHQSSLQFKFQKPLES